MNASTTNGGVWLSQRSEPVGDEVCEQTAKQGPSVYNMQVPFISFEPKVVLLHYEE